MFLSEMSAVEKGLQGAFTVLFIYLVIYVYKFFQRATSSKFNHVLEKSLFLKSKFTRFKGRTFDKNSFRVENEFVDSGFTEILKLIKKKKIKNGEISEVGVSQPYRPNRPWRVFLTVQYKEFLSITKTEKEIEVYSILDNELENSEDYKKLTPEDISNMKAQDNKEG